MNRDFKFYLEHKDAFTFCGTDLAVIPQCETGKSAEYCFIQFDTTGKIPPCSQPELLRDVIRTKKAINFQIKQWVEGWVDMREPVDYYLAEFNRPPTWVRKAIINQLKKSWTKQVVDFIRQYNIDKYKKAD